MATARTALPGRWLSRRALYALLAVSLVLNLFFIAGAVWIRMHAPPLALSPGERSQEIAAELNLDPRQQAAFDQFVETMQARSMKMRQAIAPLISRAWAEIGKPQADETLVMRQYDEASQKWRDFQRLSTTQTIAFLSILSPDQRSKFVAIVRDHRAPWLHQHRQHR